MTFFPMDFEEPSHIINSKTGRFWSHTSSRKYTNMQLKSTIIPKITLSYSNNDTTP